MWQILLILVVIGAGIWLMRRGGCCGMGQGKDKNSSQDQGKKSCH